MLIILQHSMVFVGRTHPIYTEVDRKTPKRVGNLVKSSSASLHGMLMAHKEDVQAYISGLVKSTGASNSVNSSQPLSIAGPATTGGPATVPDPRMLGVRS